MRHLPHEQADAVVLRLVDDDPGVRKTSLKVVPDSPARNSRPRWRCCGARARARRPRAGGRGL
jgi:hypothetical protein